MISTDFSPLDEINFNNVIFSIGSSDHEVINNEVTLAIEKNVLPLMSFFEYHFIEFIILSENHSFSTMLQYDTSKLSLPCKEDTAKFPYVNKYVF